MATPKTPRRRAAKVDSAAEHEDQAADMQPTEGSDAVEAAIEDAVVLPDEPQMSPPLPPETGAVLAGQPEPAEMNEAPVVPPQADPDEPSPASATGPFDAKAASSLERQPIPAPRPGTSSGFFGLLAGGLLAAAIGFGLARFVIPDGWPIGGNSAQQDTVSQNATAIADLNDKVEALSQDGTVDTISAITTELAAIREIATEAETTALAAKMAAEEIPQTPPDTVSRISSIEERLTALEQQPVGQPGADAAILNQLAAEVQALKSDLDAQQADVAKTQAEIEAAAEAARVLAEADAKAILLRASIAQVQAALQSGLPYADALRRLSDAGIEIPAALANMAEEGVPTSAELATDFADPARAALEVSLRANMGDTITERLGSFLRSQTGARSLTPKEGNDPDAILSRVDAAMAKGDLQEALAEAATLPEPAQAALADWVAQVQDRIAAEDAAEALSAELGEG